MNRKETTITALLALSAIVALAVYCVFFAPKPTTDNKDDTEYDYESAVVCENIEKHTDTTEVGSLKELSQKAGFTIKPLTPKNALVTASHFSIHSNGIAEIIYTYGKENKLIYRQSKGSGDNTGGAPVYHDYKKIRTLLLKGTGNKYGIAVWERDGFTYSITCNELLDESKLVALTGEDPDSDLF